MANQKQIGMVVGIAGVIVLLVSVLADVIGIGSSGDTFGTLQIIGTVLGIVIAGAGIAFYYYGDRFFKPKSED